MHSEADATEPSVPSKSDGIIRVMPEVLANKIAAGEVVQRPASAVKELVENALDAGATRIEVLVRDAGRTLIQVIDNGSGMSAGDAERCFERHATSKIREIQDLERILTLGFRGEALASIASVARVELRTRRPDDATGTSVRVDGGLRMGLEPCAVPGGTSISVRHLFFNVPARRAFLKSDSTELRHIVDTVQTAALANPRVGFALRHDDTVILDALEIRDDGPGALAQRIADVLGHDPVSDLVHVEESTSYLRVHGFVGRPSVRRKSRGDQYLFVNGRAVRSPYLDHAVFSAYRGLLPEGSYPFFALFLTIDSRHVDVNVHPAKSEVKFDDERGIYAMIRAVVGRTLGQAEGIPRMETRPRDLLSGLDSPGERKPDGVSGGRSGSDAPTVGGFTTSGTAASASTTSGSAASRTAAGDASRGSSGREFVSGTGSPRTPRSGSEEAGRPAPGILSQWLYGSATEASDDRAAEAGKPAVSEPSAPETVGSLLPSEASDSRPDTDVEGRLWQLQDTYIVAPIRTGLMIVDQFVAHERILYERALASLDEGFGPSQQLLFPRTIELAPGDLAVLSELLTDLKSLGFDVEPLSGRTVMIRGVPAGIRTGDEDTILEGVIAEYRELERSDRLRGRTNLARSLARRSAIRAGTRLDPREMRALIDQLFECSQPYAGPDGRPTLVRIGADELDRRFGRRR